VEERETPTSLATLSLQEAIAGQPGAQRLLHALRLADAFELEIVACPTPLHALALIAWLSEKLSDEQRPVHRLAARRSSVTSKVGTEEIARDILDPLSSATGHHPVFLDASAAHLDEKPAWHWMLHRLNERRNGLVASRSSPLIVLLPRWLEPELPAEAPDLWSIRSVTVELLGGEPARRDPGHVKESSGPWIEDLDALHRQSGLRGDFARGGSVADQRAHAAALRRYANAALDRVDLEQLSRLVDDELIPLTATLDDPVERARALRTQAAVRLRQGDSNAALEILRTLALPAVEADDAERAITLGQIADVLQVRGELDEALRIRREEVQPIYERLGDVWAKAVTMGKIADILKARGDHDEALRLLRHDLLPVFERLGDVQAKAVTMGRIADILQDRGELDEALRIHRQDELPVYERLGDVRAKAVTMGKIADILQDRGELDEALRLLRQDELPVLEQLGDVRERAVTMGKIADILKDRGEVDEALRIYRQDLLPVFERLGDVRAKAVTMGRIADILKARGEVDEALRIYHQDLLPVFERLGDVRSKAATMGKIADTVQVRGDLDRALRIHRQDALPVYERLGGRDLVVGLANLGSLLIQRGLRADLMEARDHLERAAAMAASMRISFPDHLHQWLASDAGRS